MTHGVSGVSPGAEPIEDLPVCTLVSRAQTGSLSSFAELVARFEGRLFNFLLRRTRCVADAEDLAQDTFVRAWQRIRRYDPRWRFSTWLFTIAHRLAVT
ncbi:MAG: sigma-70 family RNA polymerase sigma factor, partial [Longimicrobiales bacterium]